MSTKEVKRWQAPHMMRYRAPGERESETDHATEAYAMPCSVVLASDHDRIVAQLSARCAKLEEALGKMIDAWEGQKPNRPRASIAFIMSLKQAHEALKEET